MHSRHILFDLDGTLVDSAPGILQSFRVVLDGLGLDPAVPLDRGLIGPPLMDIVDRLLPAATTQAKQQVAEAFKNDYDLHGVLASVRFTGIDECLSKLHQDGASLWLATNKRQAPTRRLADAFGWGRLFNATYSLDSFTPAKRSKAELLQDIIERHNIDRGRAVYVGDRKEDEDAANACNLRFVMVAWGYDTGVPTLAPLATTPGALHNLIRQLG